MSMTSREQFEQAIKARFGDSFDYRVCKNSDGEYMAWDMQVAWWSWQAASKASEQQLAAVVAENAGLKAGEKFFMYSDDSGFETYKTQEEAIKAAQEMIDDCREDAYDGWPEEADTIRWGLVIQQATETDFKKPAPDNGWEGSSDYKLLPETPATDAYLAELRAQAKADGVQEYANSFRHSASKIREGHGNTIRVRALLHEAKNADEFAAQLRQGAKS